MSHGPEHVREKLEAAMEALASAKPDDDQLVHEVYGYLSAVSEDIPEPLRDEYATILGPLKHGTIPPFTKDRIRVLLVNLGPYLRA